MSTPAQIEAVAKALWEEASHREWGYWENQGGKWQEAWRKSAQAALAAAEAAAWQPIETAPKDEMFIYYWPRDGKRCIGLAYRTVSGDWRDSEGNWHIRLEPTHWLPLPPPPNA